MDYKTAILITEQNPNVLSMTMMNLEDSKDIIRYIRKFNNWDNCIEIINTIKKNWDYFSDFPDNFFISLYDIGRIYSQISVKKFYDIFHKTKNMKNIKDLISYNSDKDGRNIISRVSDDELVYLSKNMKSDIITDEIRRRIDILSDEDIQEIMINNIEMYSNFTSNKRVKSLIIDCIFKVKNLLSYIYIGDKKNPRYHFISDNICINYVYLNLKTVDLIDAYNIFGDRLNTDKIINNLKVYKTIPIRYVSVYQINILRSLVKTPKDLREFLDNYSCVYKFTRYDIISFGKIDLSCIIGCYNPKIDSILTDDILEELYNIDNDKYLRYAIDIYRIDAICLSRLGGFK